MLGHLIFSNPCLQVTDKLSIWPRITIEITQIKFMSTHAESLVSK